MKKIFTLIAVAAMAMSVNAQRIAFTAADAATAGTLDGKVFEAGNFKITLTDTGAKMVIDENAQWFGTADAQEKSAGARLKSGGKSSSKNLITVSAPSTGVLKIWARTGSGSATDRNLVLTQNETELYNKVLLESDAVKVVGLDDSDPTKETSVFPIISVEVAAGDVVVTYPVGSVNFYCFEFVDPASVKTINANAQNTATYNLAGQKVADDYKGMVIKNGKKMMK